MSLTWHLNLRDGDLIYREGECLSTDTKPTTDATLKNGSKLLEMDTRKSFKYDVDSHAWFEQN